MEIKEALTKLAHDDDDNWTADGAPRVDVVARMTGIADLKRQDIVDADPNFMRGVFPDDKPAEPVADSDADKADPEPEVPDPVGEAFATLDAELKEAADLTPEELLEATPEDLGGDLDLMTAWLRAAHAKCVELEATRSEAQNEAMMWGKRINIISRVVEKLEKRRDGNVNQSAIGKFLAQQQNARTERAARARAFLESGTSAQAILEQVAKGSKLDQAMSSRKPKPGSTRPDPRLPVRK